MKALPRRARWLYITAATVFLLDRMTKLLALSYLAGRPPVRIVPGVFLTFTTNVGGAFGMFRGVPWLFALATVVVAAVIVRASFHVEGIALALGMGMVLGGSLGNLTDRMTGGSGFFSGSVVDFVDVRIWPVFNVGDAAIVVGVVLIVASTLLPRKDS